MNGKVFAWPWLCTVFNVSTAISARRTSTRALASTNIHTYIRSISLCSHFSKWQQGRDVQCNEGGHDHWRKLSLFLLRLFFFALPHTLRYSLCSCLHAHNDGNGNRAEVTFAHRPRSLQMRSTCAHAHRYVSHSLTALFACLVHNSPGKREHFLFRRFLLSFPLRLVQAHDKLLLCMRSSSVSNISSLASQSMFH